MTHMMHYQTPFWKLALGGITAGAALYFFPFLLPALAFFFLLGLMFRFFFGHRRDMHMRPAFAARWQSMSEEERNAFKEKFGHGCCGHWDRMDAPENKSETPNT